MRFRFWFGLVGLHVILVIVGAITLTPTTVDSGHDAEIAQLLEWLHRYGLPGWFKYRQLEFTANIFMFMPLGFFAGLLVARRWLVAAIALPLLSIIIESSQLLFLPARYATVSDVIANSLGGWVGLLLAVVAVTNGWITDRKSELQREHSTTR